MRVVPKERARRIALGSQGLSRSRPGGRIDVRHFRRTLHELGLVQLDSVNVLARAHYLPFFSRLGPYPTDRLDRWLWESGEAFEYWAHEASLIPIEHRPLLAHKMDGGWHWGRVEGFGDEHPEMVAAVLEEIRDRGPITVSDLGNAHDHRSEPWWSWRAEKLALEHLFLRGTVTVARRDGFVRSYDLPERVHPPDILDEEPLQPRPARRTLLLVAARRLGIGTARDLADYHRIPIRPARELLAELVREGALEEVEVEGVSEPYLLHPEATVPRRIRVATLLSPFDPVVWHRPRLEQLFDFHYRIEIYVPAAKRIHGYYVLPFLMGDRFVARVDLKADRDRRRLLVRAAHAEPGIDEPAVASALGVELGQLAAWLDLSEIVDEGRGDLRARIPPDLSA